MHVGADFPPVSEEDADAMAPPFEQGPETPPAEAAPRPAEPAPAPAPQQAAAEPEAPRRRSTVREPAPFAEGAPPAPSPTLPNQSCHYTGGLEFGVEHDILPCDSG